LPSRKGQFKRLQNLYRVHKKYTNFYPKLRKVELVEHHGEAHKEGGLEALEVRQLGVEHEVEHLDKGEDEEEEDEQEAGEVGPAPVQRVDQHRHLQVELQDFQQLQDGHEDKQAQLLLKSIARKNWYSFFF
jgi:hypothetical protein